MSVYISSHIPVKQEPVNKVKLSISTRVENNIEDLLENLGENPKREGLIRTPERVAKMYTEMLSGYGKDPLNYGATFTNEGSHDLVVIKDIEFYSLCEHHMIPFFGSVAVGYLPNGKILGLSKFARIAEVYAKRLQVQERFTQQILDTIVKILHPQGAAVKVEAKHLCMAMRGIKKNGSSTVTTAFYGKLKNNINLRKEFLSHL